MTLGGVVCASLLLALSVNGYSFYSSIEAVLLNDRTQLCIGDCYERNGQHLCASTWSGSEDRCVSIFNKTKHFRTETNNKCISNCANFENYGHEWCAVSRSKWGRCSRRLALVATRTHATQNKFKTCADNCEKKGGTSYTWCRVHDGNWEYCSPDDMTHSFDYPTYSGSQCVTRCQLYKENNGDPYCYNSDNTWEQCFLNPTYVEELGRIAINLERHCPMYQYESQNNLQLCKKRRFRRELYNATTRIKRAPDDETENELYFNCDADVGVVALLHRSNNPTVTLRTFDATNPITMDTNPILSYTVLPTISYFSDPPIDVDLPLVLDALLTHYTLAPAGVRDAFTTRVNNNYNGVDRNLQSSNYDERGHILASRLGGPMETFNIFPQPWRANR